MASLNYKLSEFDLIKLIQSIKIKLQIEKIITKRISENYIKKILHYLLMLSYY